MSKSDSHNVVSIRASKIVKDRAKALMGDQKGEDFLIDMMNAYEALQEQPGQQNMAARKELNQVQSHLSKVYEIVRSVVALAEDSAQQTIENTTAEVQKLTEERNQDKHIIEEQIEEILGLNKRKSELVNEVQQLQNFQENIGALKQEWTEKKLMLQSKIAELEIEAKESREVKEKNSTLQLALDAEVKNHIETNHSLDLLQQNLAQKDQENYNLNMRVEKLSAKIEKFAGQIKELEIKNQELEIGLKEKEIEYQQKLLEVLNTNTKPD